MITVSDLIKILGNLVPSEKVMSLDKDLMRQSISIVTNDNTYEFDLSDIESKEYNKFSTSRWGRSCTCGADSIKSKNHSSWCDLYEYGF